MDEQKVLKEAQRIASKFPFWMVSGNINHLFGYPYETPEKKYELEIRFDESFPSLPPSLIFHEDIKELLGDVDLDTVKNWLPESHVVNIVEEIKNKILKALNKSEGEEVKVLTPPPKTKAEVKQSEPTSQKEEYITPDLDAYPPDFEYQELVGTTESKEPSSFEEKITVNNIKADKTLSEQKEQIETTTEGLTEPELYADNEELSVELATEFGLIQQEFTYDELTKEKGDINVYLTITLTKTFLIHINFNYYPKKPLIEVPEEVTNLIGDPNQTLNTLTNWNVKRPAHITDILHELENRLYFITDMESETKKILGEYRCDADITDLTKLKVNLVTYGFKEYILDVNLESLPSPPIINLSSELQQIIKTPINQLDSYKHWVPRESEVVEIVREIAWLVDKYSRINFEIELLKEHYKNIEFNSSTSILRMDMKGKMKTQDLTFQFQVDLPVEYPMIVPTIKILNEFEIESHEQIKNDLQGSFKDFFEDWTPYSYLIDLFNVISKKIFEVSVVSCVICHKIDCPSCSKKIAGEAICHIECPNCEKHYHLHCWEQTIKSFGKCGFCLRTPPPNLMPE